MSLHFDNPFGLNNEILLAFFQDFVQKLSSSAKKDSDSIHFQLDSQKEPDSNHLQPDSKQFGTHSTISDYANINIGTAFLKHATLTEAPQDVVLTIWAGCLPYLFPEEELPTCLVMTNINIFLFRIFLPENGSSQTLPKTVKEMKELLHCFYSFSLESVKEVVIGLYDQSFRIEVSDEGPRGTFVFLTRHASKTAQFLESFCSITGIDSATDVTSLRGRRSFLAEEFDLPAVVYPDEKKISALKQQLASQELTPLDDRENLISYCIVDEADPEMMSFDDVTSNADVPASRIRSLVLTNVRLFLCEEDHVHWPLPSFVRTEPATPEWVVIDAESVNSIIGINLWEDSSQKLTLAGRYGISLSFEDSVTALTEDTLREVVTKAWNLIFDSLSEREQFVRSLSCLWKNQYDQELTMTYTKFSPLKCDPSPDSLSVSSSKDLKKEHSRIPSGNIAVVVPSNRPINSPEILAGLEPNRFKDYFQRRIALDDEEKDDEMPLFLMHAGLIPYLFPENEISVAVIVSFTHIYLVINEENQKLLNADTPINDREASNALCFRELCIQDLRQVVVGLFDQTIRLEATGPETTFTLVTRDHGNTNNFLQNLMDNLLLQSPSPDENGVGPSSRIKRHETTSVQIYKLYKQDDSEEELKTEFIHPNSNTEFVYPSDETLDKLKSEIIHFIRHKSSFVDQDAEFGMLIYSLVFAETEDGVLPCTLVVTEEFLCLIKEDHVNYPLPLFVKALPETPQYQIADVRLIAAIFRIEFQDLVTGAFSIVFNRAVVDPYRYDERFKTAPVEDDYSLVTDVNTDRRVHEEQGNLVWKLRTQTYTEREKIFTVISKMWTNCYSGRSLPILKRKITRTGEIS